MGKEVSESDEFRGARFTRADLSGARFRDVNLTGAKIVDALLIDADLSGLITGLRATTADGLREGWATVEAISGSTRSGRWPRRCATWSS